MDITFVVIGLMKEQLEFLVHFCILKTQILIHKMVNLCLCYVCCFL